MVHLGRRFQPTITRIVASVALAWIGSVALASASHAATVTFNYTGADVSYTISPGTYRITVYGAQGGGQFCCAGGLGAEASAIYKIGQTLNLQIGVGGIGADPLFNGGGGGGGASFVEFEIGDPGFTIPLLVGGGGGGGSAIYPDFLSFGGYGKTTQTDPQSTGSAHTGGGGGGGGFSMNGQSAFMGGEGGASLSSSGQGGLNQVQGGFGGGGGGTNSSDGDDSVLGGGGGGGFNGGDGGYLQIANGVSTVFGAQGGTSYVNSNPDGCGPDGGPACFMGGLVLAVGTHFTGMGASDGSVTIELITGSPVPEPSTWVMMLLGFTGLGFAAIRRRAIRTFF